MEASGRAEVTQGPEFDQVKALVKSKYGAWVTVVAALNAVRGVFAKGKTQSDTAVLISLNS